MRIALPSLALAALFFLPACGPGGGGSSTTGGSSAAATLLNLKKLPLPPGAEVLALTATNVSYKVAGDVKTLFEFHRKQLLASGYSEAPGASVTEQSASGAFSGGGYKISSAVYSVGTPGSVNVMLHSHGDTDLQKLPVPAGAKSLYAGPLSALYVTETSVPDTSSALRKLLENAGWEAHGSEGNSLHFRQGLNRLSATISAAPAQGGKTMISYSCEALIGDLPAPTDAMDLRYNDSQQQITFATTSDKDALVNFYKQKLAKTGWKPTHEETLRLDDFDEMVFRTSAGNLDFLKFSPEHDGKRNVTLSFLSAEDSAELDRRAKEAAIKRQATVESKK